MMAVVSTVPEPMSNTVAAEPMTKTAVSEPVMSEAMVPIAVVAEMQVDRRIVAIAVTVVAVGTSTSTVLVPMAPIAP